MHKICTSIIFFTIYYVEQYNFGRESDRCGRVNTDKTTLPTENFTYII